MTDRNEQEPNDLQAPGPASSEADEVATRTEEDGPRGARDGDAQDDDAYSPVRFPLGTIGIPAGGATAAKVPNQAVTAELRGDAWWHQTHSPPMSTNGAAMTSLPKRGDRVRVTWAGLGTLGVGSIVVLADDAEERAEGYIVFYYEYGDDRAFSGPVKVEILERAVPKDLFADFTSDEDEDDGCVNCNKPMVKAEVITEDGAHFCSERCYATVHPEHVADFDDHAPRLEPGRTVATVHPEFARGMRRAVAIAAGLLHEAHIIYELSTQVEKELSK